MRDLQFQDPATALPSPWKVSWVPRVRRVLACIDLSPSGEALAKAAVALVNQHWLATLTLIHVVPPASWLKDSSSARLDVAQDLMEKLCSTLDRDSLPATRIVEGHPAAEICRAAHDLDADLILLASHGRTGWHRAVWGSIAEAVVHKANCSVLVFKPLLPAGNQIGQASSGTRKVAVAFDGSGGGKAALSAALQFARHGTEQLTLIRAVNPSEIIVPPYSSEVDGDRQLEEAHVETEEVAKAITGDLDVKVEVHVGTPWRVLTETTERLASDLLVMGAHQRWHLGESVLGTTCERTVRHAVCPIFVVRPQER